MTGNPERIRNPVAAVGAGKRAPNQDRSRQPPPRGTTEQHKADAPVAWAWHSVLLLSFKSPRAHVGGFVWKQADAHASIKLSKSTATLAVTGAMLDGTILSSEKIRRLGCLPFRSTRQSMFRLPVTATSFQRTATPGLIGNFWLTCSACHGALLSLDLPDHRKRAKAETATTLLLPTRAQVACRTSTYVCLHAVQSH